MELPRSSARAQVVWTDESPSTNAELSERARTGEVTPWSVLLTSLQTRGRGRRDRSWVTPPDSTLAISVLAPTAGWQLPVSWMPLIAGSALSEALAPFLRTGVKWPNDVLAATGPHAGRKLAGILSEMLPSGDIVIGSGLNLFTAEAELPTERATSVAAAGGRIGEASRLSDPGGADIADRVLSRYLQILQGFDLLARTRPAELIARVREDSLTLGKTVTVHLALGESVTGEACDLGETGELIVRLADGSTVSAAAGDVEHLR